MNSPFSLSFYQQSTRYNHKLDAKHYYYKLADVTFNTDICRKQFSSTWKRSKWPQDDNYHLRRYRNLKVKVTHTNTHSHSHTHTLIVSIIAMQILLYRLFRGKHIVVLLNTRYVRSYLCQILNYDKTFCIGMKFCLFTWIQIHWMEKNVWILVYLLLVWAYNTNNHI